MRTQNYIVATLLVSASIVALVLLLLQDDLEQGVPRDSTTRTDTTRPPTQTSSSDDLRDKTPAITSQAPPDLKGVALDPNKPRPLPVFVDSMPSNPPQMPSVAPEMPSEPPPMPQLVSPGSGDMPYDPSKYQPSKKEVIPPPKGGSQK